MTSPLYLRLKGQIAARIAGSSAPFRDWGNIVSGDIDQAVETIELLSNGDEGGTLDEAEISRSASFKATCNNLDVALTKLMHAATSVDVAAGTVSVTIPAGVAGDLVDTGVSNITDTTFTGLTAGVDYVVRSKSGVIQCLTTRAAEVTGDVEHGAFTRLGLMAAALPELEILYYSETSGKAYLLHRVKISPSSTVPLIQSGNEYASGELTGKILVKANAAVDPILGKLGVLRG